MDNQTWVEEQSVSKQELRSDILETACRLNDEKCTQQAKAMFKQYVESNGTSRYVKKHFIVDLCNSDSRLSRVVQTNLIECVSDI